MSEEIAKSQSINVEAPVKPKKVLSDKQKEVLANGRKKGLEKINEKRNISDKHGNSMKQNVNDLMKDIGDIKKQIKNEKKKDLVDDTIKLEKKQIPVLEEEMPKELAPEDKITPENPKGVIEDNSDFLNKYRVKRYTNVQSIRAGINTQGVIKPIVGKRNNPFIK